MIESTNMLNEKQKYLQIALNSTLGEAKSIIRQIPLDPRIIIEAGTPLIKAYGINGIRDIRSYWEQRIFGSQQIPQANLPLNLLIKSLEKKRLERVSQKKNIFTPYIVADLKCMDRGSREVEIAKKGGADAAVVLGHAPIETLDAFIENCHKNNLDSMIDMMNVSFPLEILRKLKELPKVVVLHRGVDEENFDRESEIPYHEIARIKNQYDIMIAVAGGDEFSEIQRAVFNDADIVVVWKSFYKSSAETAKLAEDFLREIR